MQITHPTYSDTETLKKIWKDTFGDTDEYINLFFEKKYVPENTFVIKEKETILSVIYSFPCTFRYGDSLISTAYLCGVATLPRERGKGYSGLLLQEGLKVLKQRGYQAAFIIPASLSLFDFYQKKAGFEPHFYLTKKTVYRKEDMPSCPGDEFPFSAEHFAALYRKVNAERGFYCEKTAADFEELYLFYQPEGCSFCSFPDGYLIFYAKENTLHVIEALFTDWDKLDAALQYYMHQHHCEKAEVTLPGKEQPYASLLILDEACREIAQTEDSFVNLMLN